MYSSVFACTLLIIIMFFFVALYISCLYCIVLVDVPLSFFPFLQNLIWFFILFAATRKFSIQYVENRAGKRRLLVNGYVFGRSNEYGCRTIWRCNQYREIGCLARARSLTTSMDPKHVTVIDLNHNHGRRTVYQKKERLHIFNEEYKPYSNWLTFGIRNRMLNVDTSVVNGSNIYMWCMLSEHLRSQVWEAVICFQKTFQKVI